MGWHTGEERRIADASATGKSLQAYGSHLVWQDDRSGLRKGRTEDIDIYSCNLETAEERLLAQTGGHNGRPPIHGQRVT